MTKEEIKKLNKIKSITMAEARIYQGKTESAQAFKYGFNLCRRKIRKALFGVITKNI